MTATPALCRWCHRPACDLAHCPAVMGAFADGVGPYTERPAAETAPQARRRYNLRQELRAKATCMEPGCTALRAKSKPRCPAHANELTRARARRRLAGHGYGKGAGR